MSNLPVTTERNLVPRWQPFVISSAMGETQSHRNVSRSLLEPHRIIELKNSFAATNSFGVSADILSSAITLGERDFAKEVAEFLIGCRAIKQYDKLRNLCDEIIGGEHSPIFLKADDESVLRYKVVAAAKRRLRSNFRNAIMWIDLAHAYVSLGQVEAGRRCVEMALKIDSDTRFVVRSAARFFVHILDFDRAVSILRRSKLVREDPWILASEIAISKIVDSSSRNVKAGGAILNSKNLAPFHTAELAASIGCLELSVGNDKNAKRLFRRALENPNENSLAQVEWSSHKMGGFDVNPFEFKVPFNFEALVWEDKQSRNWPSLLSNCRLWQEFEPFSSKPVVISASISSAWLGNHELAEEITKAGLNTMPENTALQNNLAYFIAAQGRLDEAENILNRVEAGAVDEVTKVCVAATRGLLFYRRGDSHSGSLMYENAVNAAGELNNKRLEFRAVSHWAYEEFRLVGDVSQVVQDRLKSLAGRVPQEDIDEALTVLSRRAEARKSEGKQASLAFSSKLSRNVTNEEFRILKLNKGWVKP